MFYFDADERVTPKLATAMMEAVLTAGETVAFKVSGRISSGYWLKQVQMTAFYGRIYPTEKCGTCGWGIIQRLTDRRVRSRLLDHTLSARRMGDWVQRHNFYSTQEAQQTIANRAVGAAPGFWQLLQSVFAERNPKERRKNMKELYYRMPARPLVKFLVMYVVKRGFLDGRAGFTYSVLMVHLRFYPM